MPLTDQKIVRAAIYPAIGIARVGNSPTAYFVGPEVIAGSTRLKAGTATKIVLNMLTTAAMIRIGKTYGNLMVDVQMGSQQRRDRALRIITIVTGLEYDDADRLLRQAHWNVKAAIVMQKGSLNYARAVSRLRRAHDVVRDAIGEDIEPRLRELLEHHAVNSPNSSDTREKTPTPRSR